jgi:hypothetical protein
MSRRSRKNILLLLCFQAMAVAIICFGSLINFHQYKIWGKPLIPNFIGYKRDVEKYTRTLSFSKQTADYQQHSNGFLSTDFDFAYELRGFHHVFATTYIATAPEQQLPPSRRVFSNGLRGPPVS